MRVCRFEVARRGFLVPAPWMARQYFRLFSSASAILLMPSLNSFVPERNCRSRCSNWAVGCDRLGGKMRILGIVWLCASLSAVAGTSAHACEDGHWIDEVLADGQILKLEDGSLWKVGAVDAVTSSIWLPVSNVIVCDDKIANVDDGETVHARRIH